ncbi:hypothetical protein DRO42_05385 [Candidatus Bathyarchaeota archaeon]|nr:MAG: hypothetical protein DRO42_05385 [Candidatus Bathyarchaeota archaeon]
MSRNSGRPEITANIRIRYRDEETARAVERAVSPDNFQAPKGITLEAEAADGELRITVACSRGLGSLIATVDDLLSCVQAAERAISGVRR